MTSRGLDARRVSVLAPTVEQSVGDVLPEPESKMSIAKLLAAGEDGTDLQHLEHLLSEIVAVVGSGKFQAGGQMGVLLDVVVDNIRCLMVEHRPARFISLSPREQQIARMVACGRTNQAIASSLEISAWTVSTHLRRIFAKLAVSSRAEMVAHLLSDPEIAYVMDRGMEP